MSGVLRVWRCRICQRVMQLNYDHTGNVCTVGTFEHPVSRSVCSLRGRDVSHDDAVLL